MVIASDKDTTLISYPICKLPLVIVNDKNTKFISDFLTQIFKKPITFLNMSSTNHPQSNGQIE